MASTLIKRIVSPDLLTQAEKDAVELELGSQNDDFKLRIHAVAGVAQEVAAGRMPSGAMNTLLTADERDDATTIITAIASDTKDLAEIERLLFLGELGYYSHAVIESILGL